MTRRKTVVNMRFSAMLAEEYVLIDRTYFQLQYL